MKNLWACFWQKDAGGFEQMMRVTSNYFFKKLRKKIPTKEQEHILDIGCGPGLIAEHFAKGPSTVFYLGMDISETYLKQCKQKFDNRSVFDFQAIDAENYLDFVALAGKSFSTVLVMSVIQYYRNIGEVETLITNLKKHIKKGGTLIIADIIVEKGKLRDIARLAWKSVLNGFFITFARFILYARFSAYYKSRQDLGLLTVSVTDLQNIIQKLGLKAEIVDNLTANPERKSLLIYM
jgi:2-polyprenyl-3-methyl-5-hydroxy-6-metoxy-1,4-benzoquinol methylase